MPSLYRPFSSLFRDDFFADRGLDVWDNFVNSGLSSDAAARPARFNPAVDIVETENAYLVKAELPGVSPENIDLQVENDVLTLRGERKYENEEERGGYRRVERSYGSFARSFALPKGTDSGAVEAQVDNGVLTVTIPKVSAASARKVEVKGGGLVDKAKKLFAKPTENATPHA